MKGQAIMPFYLRPMRPGDITQVAEVEQEAFPTLWPGTNYRRELRNPQCEYLVCVQRGLKAPAGGQPPRRGLLEMLRRRPPAPHVELDDALVGYVGVWFMGGEGHIVSIAVREAYRRKGLGELLMLGAIELSAKRGQQVVTLEVRVSNEAAQGLYRKYGLREVGRRRAYYSDNREDAYIMSTASIGSAEYRHLLTQRLAEFTERYGGVDRTYLA